MRPWYRYSEKTDNFRYARVITPFSREWGFGAPVTIGLIVANSLIWLTMVFTSGSAPDYSTLYGWWYEYFAMSPEDVLQKGRVYQVITSMFLHDGQNILHLLFNMYLLWLFGTRVERTFSSKLYLAFYLVAGLGGSILSLLMRSLMGDMVTPSLGASGAVFGVTVAYGFLFPNELLYLFFAFPVRVWKAVVGFIVIETLFILFQLQEDVDNWAHLGGAAAAAIWMLTLVKRTGNKTSHGWHHSGIQSFVKPPSGTTQDSGEAPRTHPLSGKIRIILGKKPPPQDDYPEGTDDEPPPDWFKL